MHVSITTTIPNPDTSPDAEEDLPVTVSGTVSYGSGESGSLGNASGWTVEDLAIRSASGIRLLAAALPGKVRRALEDELLQVAGF